MVHSGARRTKQTGLDVIGDGAANCVVAELQCPIASKQDRPFITPSIDFKNIKVEYSPGEARRTLAQMAGATICRGCRFAGLPRVDALEQLTCETTTATALAEAQALQIFTYDRLGLPMPGPAPTDPSS